MGNGVGSQRVEGGYFEARWKGVSLKRALLISLVSWLVSLVSWFPGSLGFLVSWFPWFPGFLGFLVSLVSWFLGFFVFLVSWFLGFLVSLVSWCLLVVRESPHVPDLRFVCACPGGVVAHPAVTFYGKTLWWELQGSYPT